MSTIGVNYASVLLDEICLEGLDGITLQALWLRLADRFECNVSKSLKEKFWKIIVNLKDVDFYRLQKPRPDLVILKRFSKVNGVYFANDYQEEDLSTSIYPLYPVDDDFGSCQHYKTRIKINSEVKATSLSDAINRWGNELVVVGTLEARWHSLAPGSPPLFEYLNKVQYCILESIGRSRFNGETFWKTVSIKGEPEDPKTLFYHRKILVSHNLVVKKQVNIKSAVNTNTIILHLTRFDIPFVTKEGIFIKNIIEAVQASPMQMIPFATVRELANSSEISDNLTVKRFLKMTELSKTLKAVLVPYKELYPDATPAQCVNKSGQPIVVRVVQMAKDNSETALLDQDDEDGAVDEDIVGSCFIGENLLHQAYNCIHAAGPDGITRRMLGKTLGLDALTARSLLRRLQFRDNLHVVLTEEKRQKKEFFVCPDFVRLRNDEFENEMAKMKSISKDVKNTEKAGISGNQSQTVEKKSLKNLKLTNLILEQIRFRRIVYEISNLVKYIDREQLSTGVNTGIVDRRTILRIIKELDQQGQLRYHRIKLEPKYSSKVLTFICEPHILTSDPYIQSIVEQAKISTSMPTKKKRAVINMNTTKFTCNNANKFMKISILHKFLFYVVYGHQNNVSKDAYSKNSMKYKDLSDCEKSLVYEGTPDGFSFVPPINTYEGWPKGWFMLLDMFLCMPLWIFTDIVSVPTFPLLDEYLKHPIKKQLLLKNIPSVIRDNILWKKTVLFSMVEKLCFIGLAKFGQRTMKDKFRIYVYMNKVGSFLDTTTSAPSYIMVEDKTYNEEFFSFDSLNNVENYWSRLKAVCLNTPMGISTLAIGEEITIVTPERKLAEYVRCYSIEEAIEMDVGNIPGDKRGAGGLDSSLFTHLRRSWGVNDFPVKSVPVSRVDSNSKLSTKLTRKQPKLPRNVQTVSDSKKQLPKGKIIKRIVMPRKVKRLVKNIVDEKDIIATRNMTSQRTTWSAKEDRIIQLSAIACNIIGSKNSLSLMTREMLYRATNIRNKTCSACRRRLLFFKKKKSTWRSMEIHISEIKQNSFIMNRYSQLYKQLLVKESSDEYPKFVKEINIHFIELVHYLHRMIYNKEVATKFLAVPSSLSDMNEKFHTYSSEVPFHYNFTEPISIQDIICRNAQLVIHIALCSNSKNLKSKKQAFGVFSQFTEKQLREAITKYNSLGIASRNKKTTKVHKVSQFSSLFGLSQSYMYHLCSLSPYSIFTSMYALYKNMIHNDLRTLNSEHIDSGMVALIVDLSSFKALDMKVQIPANILVPDPQFIERPNINTEPINATKMEDKAINSLDDSNNGNVDGSLGFNTDTVVLNVCQFNIALNCDVSVFIQITMDNVNCLLNRWISDAMFQHVGTIPDISNLFQNSTDSRLAEEIYKFIDNKEITGAQSTDIKRLFSSYDKFAIHNVLMVLKDAKLVFRVGVMNLKWVSVRYYQTWFIRIKETGTNSVKRKCNDNQRYPDAKRVKCDNSLIDTEVQDLRGITERSSSYLQQQENIYNDDIKCFDEDVANEEFVDKVDDELDDVDVPFDTFLCPRIWMKFNGSLNHRNLWRWLGAVLCFMINHPVVSLQNLCERFNMMIPFNVQLLVEMLTDMNCVKTFIIKKDKVSLWNDEENLFIQDSTVLDNYSDIQVSIQQDALLKFSYYRGMAIDAKKSQDATFSLEEMSQINSSLIRDQGSLHNVDEDEEIGTVE